MKFYVLSISGWEEYSPRWFASEKSARAFKIATRLAIRNIFAALKKEKFDGYLSGYSFLDRIVPEMEQLGFHKVAIEAEIDLQGACLYRKEKHSKRPSIFPADIWRAIIAHNDQVHKELYKDIKVK